MAQVIKSFHIVNQLGLHARAAALFVKAATRFQSEIHVSMGKKKVNGKSIMGLLVLAAGKGSAIKVEADGSDATEAVTKLGQLIEKGFYEKK